MRNLRTEFSKVEKGQGIVEFALAFPVILVIILVTIEIAHIVIIFNGVAMASREASRYASGMSETGNDGLAHWQDCQGIRDAAKRIGAYLGIQDSDIQVSYDTGPGSASSAICNPSPVGQVSKGMRITVEVTARYTPLVPIVNVEAVPITSLSSHTILTNIMVGQQ